MTRKLRYYQNNATAAVREALAKSVRRQLVQMATGTGKTPWFSCLRRNLQLPGRVLVLAHRDSLINQAVEKIRAWDLETTVGIEMADQRAGDATYVVASVATIGRKGSPR